MELIEIISWVVVSIIFFALALAYLSHTSKLRERELRKLRSPSPEAVAKVRVRDEELARTRNADAKIPKHEPQSYEKGAYWKNQPLSPKRFN